MSLFEHGIHTEDSDVRAHVSVVNRAIYVFPTRNGVAAIGKHNPEIVPAGQPGIKGHTATGWIMPWDLIEDVRVLYYESWSRWAEFVPTLTTSQKGRLAVDCVIGAMRLGRFPFWIDATEDERQNVQIAGTDIVVFCKKRVQVKCDWKCGEKPLGTGNLYLQKSERNPFGMH